MTNKKLPLSFYTRDDVLRISRELLGKYLMTNIDGVLTGGMIVETEAYNGREDKACHAYQKRTPRTEVMYEEGGRAYVYLCYGIHQLFNIVTHKEGYADAVLIRAIEPRIGVEEMLLRRGMKKNEARVTAGPGSLSKALGIDRSHYGLSLNSDTIWLEDRGVQIPEEQVMRSPRIGVDYAEEHAALPWRFTVKENPWLSR